MPLVKEAQTLARYAGKVGRGWVFTAGAWGGSLGLAGLYFTDWKVIMAHVPYIGKKYEHETPR